MYFCSHFHLIYGPATTVLCTKIAFFYYFIESLLSSRHAVVSPFQQMSYSILPSAFSCVKDPTFFGLVLKFSQICAPFLFFPCFHLFLYHCIIACHFLLEKKPDKMRCLSMPSHWFDIIFSITNIFRYKEAQVSHLLLILTLLLVPSHFHTFLALFKSFLLFPSTIKTWLSPKPLKL